MISFSNSYYQHNFFTPFPTEWYRSEAFLKPSFDIRGTNQHTLVSTWQPDTDIFVNKHSSFSNADPPWQYIYISRFCLHYGDYKCQESL